MEARKGGRRSSLLRLTEGRSLGFARGSSGDPAGSPVGDPKGPVKFASWATLADRRSFGFEGKPKGNRPGPQGLGRNPLQGTASRPHRLGVPDRGQWGLAAMPAPIRVFGTGAGLWDRRRLVGQAARDRRCGTGGGSKAAARAEVVARSAKPSPRRMRPARADAPFRAAKRRRPGGTAPQISDPGEAGPDQQLLSTPSTQSVTDSTSRAAPWIVLQAESSSPPASATLTRSFFMIISRTCSGQDDASELARR